MIYLNRKRDNVTQGFELIDLLKDVENIDDVNNEITIRQETYKLSSYYDAGSATGGNARLNKDGNKVYMQILDSETNQFVNTGTSWDIAPE